MRRHLLQIVIGVIALVVFAGTAVVVQQYVDGKARLKQLPLLGRPVVAAETYQVIEAAGTWPKLVQLTIDPRDVHVGQVQKLRAVVQSPNAIVSVEAKIETDHGTTVLPLRRIGPTASYELLPPRYAVTANRELAILVPDAGAIAALPQGVGSFLKPLDLLAGAVFAGADPPTYTYAGAWTVADTHDTTYHTTFAVKDSAGGEDSATLDWTDACGIPNDGAWTLTYNCGIDGVEGVERGNATINNNTALTIPSGKTFVFNPGYHVTMGGTNARILIASGGQMRKTYLWATDADSDGWIGTVTAADTGTYRRWQYLPQDCNDNNPAVHPNEMTYYENPISGTYGYDYDCSGSEDHMNIRLYTCDPGGTGGSSGSGGGCGNPCGFGGPGRQLAYSCNDGWASSDPGCGSGGTWCGINGYCLGGGITCDQECNNQQWSINQKCK